MALVFGKIIQECNGVAAETTFDYWKPGGGGEIITLDDLDDISDHLAFNVMPALNAIQHPGVVNVGVYCLGAGTVLSTFNPEGGGGTRSAVPAAMALRSLAFTFFCQVGDTLNPLDGTVYATTRPIRRGYRFPPGIADDLMNEGRPDFSVIETELEALEVQVLDYVTPAVGNPWTPVVFGNTLEPLPPNHPGARAQCVAQVLGFRATGISSLKGRKSRF